MLVNELVNMLSIIRRQQAESQVCELKKAHDGCPRRLYDTLSSFSNQDTGGTIIFGIDENNNYEITGVYDAQDLQKKVTEQCNQMEPPVRALFTLAEIEGKTVCSAEIPSLDITQRPCYYSGAGKVRGSYIRVGDADLPMTDFEIYSFDAFRGHLHDDERTVERASLDTMNAEQIEMFLQTRKAERPGFAKMTEAQILEMTNICREDKFTLAAVLNFGVYPQGYFPQLCITGIAVPGRKIGDINADGERFLDNKRIEGTIPEMIDAAMGFCLRNMKTRVKIDSETGRRTDRTEYPADAIREAVLNALIHRDYSIFTEGTPVQINFFEDRLEIHSPGGLYGRMSVEQLGFARPDLRNPALATMTEEITSAENRYSGIPTMRRAMKEAGLPEPVFENRRNEFVVTFYNSSKDRPNNTECEDFSLLEFCETPRTKHEIADFLGIKTTFYVMSHYVKPLLESGQMKMTMPDKPQSSKQKYYTVK